MRKKTLKIGIAILAVAVVMLVLGVTFVEYAHQHCWAFQQSLLPGETGTIGWCDPETTTGWYALTIGGIIGLIVGPIETLIGLIAAPRVQRVAPEPGPALYVTPPVADQVIIKETIIKEVVKVKCPFCGTLVDHLASTCPHCLGNLK